MSTTHEPAGYVCPFCRLVADGRNDLMVPEDIVARTDGALAFISPRWLARNPGHVLVVSIGHHENLYQLPPSAGHAVHDLVREMAIAIRLTYGCTGVSTRQHNEPDGYQDVWHYHVHVSPRFDGDDLYRQTEPAVWTDPAQRRPYADRIRRYLAEN